jgi:hypothetical protein
MVYAQKFLRLVVIGELYGIDNFSFSMSLIADQDNEQPPQSVPQGVIDAVTNFWTAPLGGQALTCKDAKIQTIKLNEIGVDGRYTSAQTIFYDYPVPLAGLAGVQPAPQVALAITLGTQIKRGRAAHGRFYVPLPGVTLDPGTATTGVPGTMSSSIQQLIADHAAKFLNDVNAAVVGYRVGVVSDIGTGTYQPVTSVRVGRVLDTIRSRRNKFPEQHYTSPTAIHS